MPKKPTREASQVRAFRALLLGHARITDQVKKRLMDECGLGLSEFDMLAELGNQPGLKMGELAEKMISSPGNVTRVAQSLEQKGLVSRMRSPQSEREVVAQLTPEGEAFFLRHFPVMVDALGAIWDAALNKAEQAELAVLLDKLSRAQRP